MRLPVVLYEACQEPLRQLIAADAEVDRLCVILHVGQCQLAEGRRRCATESEGAEYGSAGLTARAARGVMDHTSAKSQVVFAKRPRQGVRKLHLMAKDVGGSRLSDGERYGSRA